MVCFLLIVLGLQLFFSVRRESQTWDEANHIFTGYRTWTDGDYGLNPEHPPLVKLLTTAPRELRNALELAKKIEPEFQTRSLPAIEQRLQSVANVVR